MLLIKYSHPKLILLLPRLKSLDVNILIICNYMVIIRQIVRQNNTVGTLSIYSSNNNVVKNKKMNKYFLQRYMST